MEEIEQKDEKLFIPNENIYKAHILDENGEVSHVFIFCAGPISNVLAYQLVQQEEKHLFRYWF